MTPIRNLPSAITAAAWAAADRDGRADVVAVVRVTERATLIGTVPRTEIALEVAAEIDISFPAGRDRLWIVVLDDRDHSICAARARTAA